MKVIVSNEIETLCPTFVGACVEAQVENSPYCEQLWEEIDALSEKYKQTLTTETLKLMDGIAANAKCIALAARTHHVIVLLRKHSSAECCKAKNYTR